MINYSGEFTPAKAISTEQIPVGAYIGKIVGAKVEDYIANNNPYQRLVLALDVTEGEYKDYYSKLLEAQQGGSYAPKYKGVLRLNIPKEGDAHEGMNKRILQGAIWCIEDSNKGYKWDWDEAKLKGKVVGFSVRERDWIMEDATGLRSGTTTEIGKLESINDVRAGNVKPMKKRELRDSEKARLAQAQAETNAAATFTETQDDDLPF